MRSMIIDDANLVDISAGPPEYNTPLFVHPDSSQFYKVCRAFATNERSLLAHAAGAGRSKTRCSPMQPGLVARRLAARPCGRGWSLEDSLLAHAAGAGGCAARFGVDRRVSAGVRPAGRNPWRARPRRLEAVRSGRGANRDSGGFGGVTRPRAAAGGGTPRIRSTFARRTCDTFRAGRTAPGGRRRGPFPSISRTSARLRRCRVLSSI